jgi:DNA adenine methylase
MKIFVPPIKCQGIKTKLVAWIKENMANIEYDRWVEPFMGSGVVGFNVRPKKAIFADLNPHLINFYNSIKNGDITAGKVRSFLESEGKKLSKEGQNYYNEVRNRFNEKFEPLDFLFLNRSCFNGMIRFNQKGKFNVPFGHKPNRFSKAYITKIVNQVDYIHQAVKVLDWNFICQDFKLTIEIANKYDIIYCDPPYLGRHVDYFDSWDEQNENDLFKLLESFDGKYILSTWHSNKFRNNDAISKYDSNNILTKEHFYHVGASEKNRNAMLEALIINYDTGITNPVIYNSELSYQPRLLELQEKYLTKIKNKNNKL